MSVTIGEVDALLGGRISLTAEMATKPHKMFGTSSEFWMNLQNNYEIYQIRLGMELENSFEAQFQLIADTYADGDDAAIDVALTQSNEGRTYMHDLIISDISAVAFEELTAVATQNSISIEEQAKRVIEGFFLKENLKMRPEVSETFLKVNADEVFAAAERSPVFVRSDKGDEFVIVSIEEFERLVRAHDNDK